MWRLPTICRWCSSKSTMVFPHNVYSAPVLPPKNRDFTSPTRQPAKAAPWLCCEADFGPSLSSSDKTPFLCCTCIYIYMHIYIMCICIYVDIEWSHIWWSKKKLETLKPHQNHLESQDITSCFDRDHALGSETSPCLSVSIAGAPVFRKQNRGTRLVCITGWV